MKNSVNNLILQKKLINLIDGYEIIDSFLFTEGPGYEIVLKLKKDITFNIPIEKKESL